MDEQTNFKAIEKKWQEKWEKKKIFQVKESKKKKFYVLEMFPYPSGSGLHMGHAFNYTIGDIFARFKRAQGYNVLYPMGYDSLGLPAENAAIKEKIHPKKYTDTSVKNFIKQQKALGLSYDWSRMVKSHEPDYYKWDQWIFLKMFEKGLVYKKKASANFCPKCNSVLANEQVHNGKCWRHEDTEVKTKELEQWFFKITDYAEELYDKIDSLNWPERIKIMQKNWINKKEWIDIDYKIDGTDKISNVIIVHGSNASKKDSQEGKPENERHWKPWLKKELKNKGIEVSNELYPEDWLPNYEKWKKVFEKNKVDNNSILIGHSAGATFLLRWLVETKKKVNKLVLVAPSVIPYGKYLKESNLKKFDYDSSLKNYFNELIIFYSDNDDGYIIKSAKQIHSKLNGELINLKNKGHFTLNDMKTEEFPELLDKIETNKKITVSTTRPDTNFGATFIVVAPEHPMLSKEAKLIPEKYRKEVDAYIEQTKKKSEEERIEEAAEKTGVFTGLYCINQLTNKKMPIWVTDFVLMSVGTGAVVGVPGHDIRDFEFAKKHNLPVIRVVVGKDGDKSEITKKEQVQEEEGKMINSGFLDGLDIHEATRKIMDYIEKKGWGRRTIRYRLKDWLVSRQRYWGTPIPIIYCEKCGIVPVPEKQLPVKLPEKVKFGIGNPLETAKSWINTKCPKCKGKAKRETDTMDTFVNSSWYFLRYCDSKNKKQIFDKKKVAYWMPIDQYIGGAEHACMHLIYFRFYTKFLRDLGLLKIDEPALRLFNQGMLHKEGVVMSKSKGNVVLPEEVSEKYGIDSARLFLVSLASPDKDIEWSEQGIQGSLRFINKVIEYFTKFKQGSTSKKIESKLNKTIKGITEDIENFRYNLAVIKLRELFENIEQEKEISKKDAEVFLKLLSPFCPHIAEELWSKLGNKDFISLADWPKADEKKIDKKFEIQDKAAEKLKEDINNIKKIIESKGKKAEKVYVYVLPKELELYKSLESEEIKIFSAADKSKYDPQNKAGKAKPGKPAIYLE